MWALHPIWWGALALGGLVVGYVVALLLFRLGCAMADLEPSLTRSLLAGGLTFALFVLVAAALFYLARPLESDPSALIGPMRAIALGVAVLITWGVSTLLYALLLSTPVKKGLVVASFERILGTLLAVLLAGVVLVVLAVAQIIRTEPEKKAPVTLQSPPAGHLL
jgi:site-specific recombinase